MEKIPGNYIFEEDPGITIYKEFLGNSLLKCLNLSFFIKNSLKKMCNKCYRHTDDLNAEIADGRVFISLHFLLVRRDGQSDIDMTLSISP